MCSLSKSSFVLPWEDPPGARPPRGTGDGRWSRRGRLGEGGTVGVGGGGGWLLFAASLHTEFVFLRTQGAPPVCDGSHRSPAVIVPAPRLCGMPALLPPCAAGLPGRRRHLPVRPGGPGYGVGERLNEVGRRGRGWGGAGGGELTQRDTPPPEST